MEYRVTAAWPFDEIEKRTVRALEQEGFVVQRTFSLRSAAGAGDTGLVRKPDYSVLLLYAPGAPHDPLGLVTLYQHEGATVICPAITAQLQHRRDADHRPEDMAAEVVAALASDGLDLCVQPSEGGACIGLEPAAGGCVMGANDAGVGPWDGPWPQ